MKVHRKHRLFIALLVFLVIIGVFGLLFYPNKPKDINVLLITIDALRPDHLGCYGYNRNTSPNIDRLAREGIMFTQVITQASYTAASIAAIFTSTFPREHGVNELYEQLNANNVTLAEVLKLKGYNTKAITGNFIISEKRGFEQGFDSYEFKGDELDYTPAAIEWLKNNKDRPFFLWIHYMFPHPPYTPPAPYNKIYLNGDNFNKKTVEKLKIVNNFHGIGGIPKYLLIEGILDLDYYISQYDGEINLADNEVGTLLNKLNELNLNNKTSIILTADHGEDLGEHNYYFSHGATLYDTSIRVPLIIKIPSIIPRNIIIDTQARTIDIMPTILDILGIRINKKIEGYSLLPLILKKHKDSSYTYAFSYTQNKVSIRTNEWKLIYDFHDKKYELYNLKEDPEESTNLVKIEKERFQFFEQRLNNYMKRALPKTTKPKQPLDEQTKEKLKSLGYLQ